MCKGKTPDGRSLGCAVGCSKVQQEAPGIRAILVGNGKSLLKRKMGNSIDQFDVVGRFNYFR